MLSRAGNDASAHLRRTKSATSVKQRRHQPLIREPVDPKTARTHAVTAAHVAMGRANERASIEMRRSAELAKCDGNAGMSANRPTARSQPLHFSPASELRRQRSILQSKASSIVSSSSNKTEHPHTDLSHYNLPPPSELVVTGCGSEPSSYRKLRKVKSVLTPRKRAMSMHNMSSCSPYSARTLRNMKSSLGDAEQGLKHGLKRSMSFLRGSSGNLSKAFTRAECQTKLHDEAIQLAQEQFFNDLEQQRLRQKPPFFLSTKARQQQKALRKTVRSSRTTNLGDGIQSENQDEYVFKPEPKSRSISSSFRDKMKRIFSRSVSNKEKFPAQQLDASRSHFREYIDGSGLESALDEYFVGDNDATARGSLYIPSNHEHDSLEDLDRMSATLRSAHSMESLHSNTSRSRVTSWTNSTATITNSIAARGTPLERKRLSIIKEDGGPHQPSSSIGRHVGGIGAFRNPVSSQNTPNNLAPPVDSQRIYSALMKRIDQEQADAESLKHPTTPVKGEANTLPSSAQSYQTAPTIRAVSSEASIRTGAPNNDHRQSSIGSQSWNEDSSMTPQELAQHNESIERRRQQLADQEQQSSFFPFSNQSKPLTPSPFKLALTARKEDSGTSQSESGSVILRRTTHLDDQVQGKFVMSSDSIYSRTTDDHANPQNFSHHTSPDDTDESPPMGGMATILPTKSARCARYPRPTSSLVQLHRARSTERGEWKGWMEHQMTTLDRRHSRASTSHHREHAQINGDDTAIGGGSGRPPVSSGFGPILGRHGLQKTVITVKDNQATIVPLTRSSSIMNERFPLLDLKEVTRNKTPKPIASESQRASMIELNDENKKLSGADVQMASGPLQGKKSQVFSKCKVNDENSLPPSTPGRLYVAGHENLKTASFAHLEEVTPTPKQRPKSHMDMADLGPFGSNITNESDRILTRSSRPMYMDISNGDCPFDKEYFSTEQSCGKGSRVGRLRVASAARAGTPGYSDVDEEGDTALPKVEEKAVRSESRKTTSSKRMVSNFLRSRRRNTPAKNEVEGATNVSSPAFV